MKVDSVDKPTGSVDGAVKAPIDQDLVEERRRCGILFLGLARDQS